MGLFSRRRVDERSKNFILLAFFKITSTTLSMAAAFPDKKPLSSLLKTRLLYNVWPVVFILAWVPMALFVGLKINQYKSQKQWDDLLDIMHMCIIGYYCLYIGVVIQLTSRNYKNTIEIITQRFFTFSQVTLSDLIVALTIWITVVVSFFCYVGGCMFYGEVLVPMYIPLFDNDRDLPPAVFFSIWVYQGFASIYICLVFMVIAPFMIVSSTCICKELDLIINLFDSFRYSEVMEFQEPVKVDSTDKGFSSGSSLPFSPELCHNEKDSHNFIRYFVEHHQLILRVINEVSRIHNYIYLVQTVVTVVLSCFLSFNVYYTQRLQRVLIKSCPILFLSYFIMFAYCWNGQRFTDKCEELQKAVCRCPWYTCPRSFRTSLLVLLEVFKSPKQLTAAGIFPATLETFLKCMEQNISYILLLDTLTSQKTASN